jgi:hypothetical protein
MGWLTFGVCVLLDDGSGGVFFLVSSRSICLLVPRWYFLWGPFRGGIFFGVRFEGIFLCLLPCRISETHHVWRSWTSGIYGG